MFTISALAREADVGVETIRYYQREGLVRTPPRPPGGIRRYDDRDLARLRFIRSAQRVGFSLREIRVLLEPEDGGRCDQVRRIARRRLADVRARIADLTRMDEALSRLVADCRSMPGGTPDCPLIRSLQVGHRVPPGKRRPAAALISVPRRSGVPGR